MQMSHCLLEAFAPISSLEPLPAAAANAHFWLSKSCKKKEMNKILWVSYLCSIWITLTLTCSSLAAHSLRFPLESWVFSHSNPQGLTALLKTHRHKHYQSSIYYQNSHTET